MDEVSNDLGTLQQLADEATGKRARDPAFRSTPCNFAESPSRTATPLSARARGRRPRFAGERQIDSRVPQTRLSRARSITTGPRASGRVDLRTPSIRFSSDFSTSTYNVRIPSIPLTTAHRAPNGD